MKYIEIEILDIIMKWNNPEATAKAIYKRLFKYFKKCCNDDCKYYLEGVCTFYRNGQTVSCTNQKQKEQQ